ncbi:MAG: hypothetical protein IPM77_18465 [Crocinitomicaceae bacterium]|nr:hypothetical protein [Crocinitomicaceae bacterium]
MIQRLVLLSFLFSVLISTAQPDAYNYINIQGQLPDAAVSSLDLEFKIYDSGSNLLWSEIHNNVTLHNQGVFHLQLGGGVNSGGSIADFSQINWLNVSEVKIYNITGALNHIVATVNSLPVPYSFHSLTNLTSPFVINLTDVNTSGIVNTFLLKFDGVQFYVASDMLSDTAEFAFISVNSLNSDTALVAADFIGGVNDSALYSFYSDSSQFAQSAQQADYAENSIYSDTANVSFLSLGNWSKTGNTGTTAVNYIGTTDSVDFILRTNGSKRLTITPSGNYYNGNLIAGNSGFTFTSTSGALFQPSVAMPGLSSLGGSFLYFDGQKSAFSGGKHDYGLDTTMRQYSISWGENNSGNAIYSVMFGLNNHGDSSWIAGIGYSADASFTMGRNCVSSLYSVAIGDSARTDYIRNVAIGKNVYAGIQSSSVGIGTNVISVGATAWAAGLNVTANGHFSTVLGTNASSNGFRGCFLYGDSSTASIVSNTAQYQFMVRASGGTVFYTASDLSMGVELLPGAGSWSMISDRNKKENINLLSVSKFSDQFKYLDLFTWTYKEQDLVHIGPMAQDFNSLFGVGELPNYINMIDIDGITFWGIKSLHSELNVIDKKTEVDSLNNLIHSEFNEYELLENRIKELYENTNR